MLLPLAFFFKLYYRYHISNEEQGRSIILECPSFVYGLGNLIHEQGNFMFPVRKITRGYFSEREES